MESQVSPKNIEARVEAMAASSNPKPIETPAAPEVKAPEAKAPETKEPEVKAPEAKAPEAKAPEVKAPEVKAPEAKAPEVKAPEVKAPEKKQPNDPNELRKWSTKLSQENAQLRDEMKSIKAALDKMTKKPVDYAELAKNPDSLKAHIEAERQEAIKDLQQQLAEKNTLALKNETMYERAVREKDKVNYPLWEKLFPRIQALAAVSDGRVNWNQAPSLALDEAYALAEWLESRENPTPAPAPTPVEEAKPVVPAAPALTEEQIQARIAEAVTKAKAEAEANLRAEVNGGGVGSAGRGGRRDANSSNEAFKTMPLKDLKKVITPK